MRKVAVLFAVGLLLPAQTIFRKAPPDVEEALRARVGGFYKVFVDGKFRQAEAFVAEEHRDEFYNIPKVRIYRFEIDHIDFADDFQSAKVQVSCEMTMAMLGGSMSVPLWGKWKLIGGQWQMILEKRPNLFGPSSPAAVGPQAPRPSGGPPPNLGQNPLLANPQGALDALQSALRVEPQMLAFPSAGAAPASQSAVIRSGIPGYLELEVQDPKLPGLTLSLSAKQLPPSGQVTLDIQYNPKAGKVTGAHEIKILARPIMQTASVHLRFE